MNISDLDIPLLAEHVRKLAEAEPQTKSECLYFNLDTGEAQCIVGQALALQGVILSDLEADGQSRNAQTIVKILNDNDDAGGLLEWLGSVQYHQDQEYSWEQAIYWADRA